MEIITKEKALEIWDTKDVEIFLLYSDSSEGLVVAREEIENFDGMFGIETKG